MELVRDYKAGEYIFDSLKDKFVEVCVDIDCETIAVNYENIIATQFQAGNVGEDLEQLKQFLNLGIYSKAPSGGWVNFYRVTGDKGGTYILYSGVNEVYNSIYIVTLHKILKA